MANNNQDRPETKAPDKANELTRIAATAFTMSGYAPLQSVFRMTESQINTEVLRIAKGFIAEFERSTIDIDFRYGAVFGIVWLPSNSAHVIDTSTSNTMLGKSIPRYSKELKEFMDKFCDSNKKSTVEPYDKNINRYVGIEVRLDRFFDIIFDKNGFEYKKRYNLQYPVATALRYEARFTKGDNNGFGRFKYVEIRKSVIGDRDTYDLKPKRSFNV